MVASVDVVEETDLVEAGADLIVGHHAHRVQPLVRVEGVPVFYDLGNFVWHAASESGARSAVAEWVLQPDGETRACLIPFEIDDLGVPHPTDAGRDCG